MLLLHPNTKSLQPKSLQIINNALFHLGLFSVLLGNKFFPVVPDNLHGVGPCTGVLVIEIFEEKKRVDEYFVLFVGNLHIGEVQSIVSLAAVFLFSQCVLAGLNGLGVIFEFEVTHS